MRESGLLLHISSLPSPYGIGTLGKCAYEFIDFLKRSGQKYWQVLPIGPTSYGDSPYQTFSAFAGNPYFIDLDILVEKGLLVQDDLKEIVDINVRRVNYESLYHYRFNILRKAFSNFKENNEYLKFVKDNNDWLNDYALFMAIKFSEPDGSFRSWNQAYQDRYSKEVKKFEKSNQEEINFWKFIQYEFFTEWKKLKEYANESGIKIIGDMPIYVSYDSADVWSDPKNFKLDEDLNPTVVAGVPPDYFSKTGQLWGNPIYDYKKMAEDGYSWWIKRIKKSFELFDVVRIDHFRGFEAYYEIPYGETTALNGRWVKGPNIKLFNKIKEELGELNIIAEDLGLLTPSVYKMLEKTGYPGMRVLEFGFTPDEDSIHLPHNYVSNTVCYTGTHDNATLKEWLETCPSLEKDFVYRYANINNDFEATDKLIKLVLASVSNLAIIPVRDYLGLGSEGRFNIPSTLGGNWTWRLLPYELTKDLEKRILYNTKIYKR